MNILARYLTGKTPRALWAAMALAGSLGIAFAGNLAHAGDLRQLTGSEVSEHLQSALSAVGIQDDQSLRFYQRNLEIYVKNDGGSDQLGFDNLSFDRNTGYFTASVKAMDVSGQPNVTRITGQVVDIVNVPTLRTSLRRGDEITAGDITWIELPSRQVRRNVITDAEDLVGMTAVRSLAEGRPIAETDVRRPILVKKGSLAQMTVSTPSMTLSATGRAMEHGSSGDMIRLVNISTHQSVEGLVMPDGSIAIRPTSSQFSLASR